MAIRATAFTTSGDTVISAGQIQLWGFGARNTTANAATLTLYDNATVATGTVIYSETIAANVSSSRAFNVPILARNGVVASLTGTTPNVAGSVWVG
jgi:hypothetical protein